MKLKRMTTFNIYNMKIFLAQINNQRFWILCIDMCFEKYAMV